MLNGIEKFIYDLYSIRYRIVWLMNGNTKYKTYFFKLHEPIINEFGWFIAPDNDCILNLGIHELVIYDVKEAMPLMLKNKAEMVKIEQKYLSNKGSITNMLIQHIPIFSYDKELRTRVQKEKVEYLNQFPLNIDASTLHIKHYSPIDYKNTLNMASYGKILKKAKESPLKQLNGNWILYAVVGVIAIGVVYILFQNKHIIGL